MAEKRLAGRKTPDGEVKWLACMNLTPWQKHKLLEVCISMKLKDVEEDGKIVGEVAAVEINHADYGAIETIINQEKINSVRHGAHGTQ